MYQAAGVAVPTKLDEYVSNGVTPPPRSCRPVSGVYFPGKDWYNALLHLGERRRDRRAEGRRVGCRALRATESLAGLAQVQELMTNASLAPQRTATRPRRWVPLPHCKKAATLLGAELGVLVDRRRRGRRSADARSADGPRRYFAPFRARTAARRRCSPAAPTSASRRSRRSPELSKKALRDHPVRRVPDRSSAATGLVPAKPSLGRQGRCGDAGAREGSSRRPPPTRSSRRHRRTGPTSRPRASCRTSSSTSPTVRRHPVARRGSGQADRGHPQRLMTVTTGRPAGAVGRPVPCPDESRNPTRTTEESHDGHARHPPPRRAEAQPRRAAAPPAPLPRGGFPYACSPRPSSCWRSSSAGRSIQLVITSFQEFGRAQMFGAPPEFIGLEQLHRRPHRPRVLGGRSCAASLFCLVSVVATMRPRRGSSRSC